ncbi:MAG: cytidine deaminase [Crocinitomicaceae bacterium]
MNEITIKYQEFESFDQLSDEDLDLIDRAFIAASNAYAPYSNFQVGASVLLNDGTIVLGNNQENSAYPSGICAERTALFYAGANFPQHSIKKMAIVAFGDAFSEETFLSPCGSCRQVMLESGNRQDHPFEILLTSPNKKVIKLFSAKDLLPLSFKLK